MSLGFTRCPQIYDGGGRKTRTTWFKSRGTSAQWIHSGRGCNLCNFIMMIYNYIFIYGTAYYIFCSRIQIIGLRSAYRKIFMSADANSEGLEERLNEVVLSIKLDPSVSYRHKHKLKINHFCRNSMKNWLAYLQFVP